MTSSSSLSAAAAVVIHVTGNSSSPSLGRHGAVEMSPEYDRQWNGSSTDDATPVTSYDDETMSTVSVVPTAEAGLRWSALCLCLIVAATAVGNILLCAAVVTERRLQNMTNYFLTSLAVADLLVAVLVMPLALVNELFGQYVQPCSFVSK